MRKPPIPTPEPFVFKKGSFAIMNWPGSHIHYQSLQIMDVIHGTGGGPLYITRCAGMRLNVGPERVIREQDVTVSWRSVEWRPIPNSFMLAWAEGELERCPHKRLLQG